MARAVSLFVVAALGGSLASGAARGEDGDAAPARPSILFNRWQEDWSVLADPRVAPEPLDSLKYIPLSAADPQTYLSFGGGIRERYEGNGAPSFGAGSKSQAYDISRAELHADLRLDQQVQAFVQLQSDFAPGKNRLSPVDQDRLDLEQAFVAVTEPVGDDTLKLRLGRQQFAFDLQRFISARDGPNVRQSYDAAWADYETGKWRLIGFYSQPVQNRDLRVFDDYSSDKLTLSGVRVERELAQSVSLSAYYTRYTQASSRYLTVVGHEARDNFDIHLYGAQDGFDWDAEAMGQTGRVGTQAARAWAVGSLAGYTFADTGWSPRIGLQVDAASGDNNPHDGKLETFNPLFPNGAYVTLAGYTGYVNFIQVKPSLTVHPSQALKVMFAFAPQWRQTTADAVYTQPNVAVPGTAGQPGLYTGLYQQLRMDWALSRSTSFAIEAVHFDVSDTIRRAGGHDGDYIGVQIAQGW